MVNFMEYEGIIKAAVEKECQADENWNWRIVSIKKGAAKIGWGYLDHIGKKKPFSVEIDKDEDLVFGIMPSGNMVTLFIGPEQWRDCKTIEEGIACAIHKMAEGARKGYAV